MKKESEKHGALETERQVSAKVILFDKSNYRREFVKVNGKPAELFTLKTEAVNGAPKFLLFIDGHFQKLEKKVEVSAIEEEIQAEPQMAGDIQKGNSKEHSIEWSTTIFNYTIGDRLCGDSVPYQLLLNARNGINISNPKTPNHNG